MSDAGNAAAGGAEPPVDAGEWRKRAEQAERELAVRKALAGVEWLDAEDAYRELSAGARQDERGAWVVEAAQVLAERKPHWVRARVSGGSGAGSGVPAGLGHGGTTLEELLRPENTLKLKEMLANRPEDYERLWAARFGRK